jgi:hypothetical protein
MLYLISPSLTGADVKAGTEFAGGMKACLAHEEIAELDSDLDLDASPNASDVVVVFNPSTGGKATSMHARVAGLLGRALEVGARVLPVALDPSSLPPPPLSDRVPYSVSEIMILRSLQPWQTSAAGRIFARLVLSEMRPTFSKDRLQLFLSYCQSDGDALARRIGTALIGLQQQPLRDLHDLRTGEALSRSITAALESSDVLVLLDTPDAANSGWVKAEICLALGMGIPIVWVRFLHPGGRSSLPVWPAETPDLEVASLPQPGEHAQEVASTILDLAHAAANVHVRRAQACLRRAGSLATLRSLDTRRQIFEIQRQRRLGPFELRPERHILQLFARRPSPQDRSELSAWLESEGYAPQDPVRRAFDLAVMMSPAPGGAAAVSGPLVTTHGVGFVTQLASTGADTRLPTPDSRPELLLLGAFPRGSGAGQEVRDAVHEVSTLWLSRGGRIRFGGHPTITPLVTWVAQTEVPSEERERVTIFQSLYFATPAALREVADLATVIETPVSGSVQGDRGASLSLMRERMITGSNAAAAVLIGGRTDEGGTHVPGTVEELALARAEEIPVFVLGATGGQASVVAAEARAEQPPWSGLGSVLGANDMEWLADTDDYWSAADTIWRTVVDST